MATSLHGGPRTIELTRDDDGSREYRVVHLVRAGAGDGPATVLLTTGLPQPGDVWRFGDVEVDVWAWCRLNAQVRAHDAQDGEPIEWYTVEQVFSTKPPQQTEPAGDPLLQRQKISGSFSKSGEEITFDRFGNPVLNSSFEQIRGPQVEFESGNILIRVEQNVADLALPVVRLAMYTLNSIPLWGAPVRMVRLSGFSWDEHDYWRPDPVTGAPIPSIYYTRNFEFEASPKGWDRDIVDEGTKVIRGRWDKDPASPTYRSYLIDPATDPDDPAHYDRYQDWTGNPSRLILDHGTPALSTVGVIGSTTTTQSAVGSIHVEKYGETDFVSVLGIRSTL